MIETIHLSSFTKLNYTSRFNRKAIQKDITKWCTDNDIYIRSFMYTNTDLIIELDTTEDSILLFKLKFCINNAINIY